MEIERQKIGFVDVAVVLIALAVAFFSQHASLMSAYVVNDDVCQHIWWMQIFREPGLFQNDLLFKYAVSLEHFGNLILYRLVSLVMEPLAFTKVLVFILFPLSAWALYRLVRGFAGDVFTAFISALAFVVTPIYIQHMTGGQAHVFGFPLLILFLYFLLAGKYRAAAVMVIAAVLFFPVIFVIAVLCWLCWCVGWEGKRPVWQGATRGARGLLTVFTFGILVLAVKVLWAHDPAIGNVLGRDEVSRMPELTAAGRWDVWPVESIGKVLVRFVQEGLFFFKALSKSFLSADLKDILIGYPVVLGLFLVGSASWWWRKRAEFSVRLLAILVGVSVALYLVTAAVILKLYAPDRYLSYSISVAALIFMTIPFGMTVSSMKILWVRRVFQVLAVAAILFSLPLTRHAGLKDYSEHRGLYEFLKTVPKTSLIAVFPDTADAIPLFSGRKVLVNEELSVPLYDRYWQAVKARTMDLLAAYYAEDQKSVLSFCRKYGITYWVVERHRFSPEFLSGRIYFEPFGSWAKARLRPEGKHYLQDVPSELCSYATKDICVVATSVLANWKNEGGTP